MLVLSRKKGETVIIGNGYAEVTIMEIRGDKVRLGFRAAQDVPIHRQEIQEKIEAGVAQARAQGAPQTSPPARVLPE